jgi:hypothetical protein
MTAPDPSPLLAAARLWFDAGYSVVPTHEDGSKRPFGPWKQYQTERPTWDQIEAWLASGKYTGIGVITGAVSGNVEMIELEGPNTIAAIGKLSAVADKYRDIAMDELLRKVLHGCVESSPRAGLHMFVKITGGPVPGNTKLAMDDAGKVLAETRGEGGFVVVAPTPARSGHEENTVYMFVGTSTPADTVTISADEVEALHYLFTEALHSHTEPLTPTSGTTTPPSNSGAQRPLQGDGLTPWDDFTARTTWAQILEPMGWQAIFAAPDGRIHWTRPGKKASEGTSATTITDGPMYVFSTSTVLPANEGMSKMHVYTLLHHGGDHKAAARALAGDGYGEAMADVSLPSWEFDLPTGATDEQVADAKAAWVNEKFPRLDWQALWDDETEEEWIAEPLLPARRLVALYSAPKVGKSLLMLEIAANIADGRPMFAEQNYKHRQARVLYVDFENDPRGDVRSRLVAMGFTPENLTDLYYLSFPTMAGLDSERGSQELMAAVQHYGCEVVVIDTVSRSVDGDENENDTWLDFYRHTGLKLKQNKIAMIRLDHSGKDETKGQRGGSAKSGDVDAVWRMSRVTDDLLQLKCEANRFPLDRKNITLERNHEPLFHRVKSDAAGDRIARVLQELRDAKFPKEPKWTMGMVREEAKARGMELTPNQKGQGITTEIWAEYCQEPQVWTLKIAGQDV